MCDELPHKVSCCLSFLLDPQFTTCQTPHAPVPKSLSMALVLAEADFKLLPYLQDALVDEASLPWSSSPSPSDLPEPGDLAQVLSSPAPSSLDSICLPGSPMPAEHSVCFSDNPAFVETAPATDRKSRRRQRRADKRRSRHEEVFSDFSSRPYVERRHSKNAMQIMSDMKVEHSNVANRGFVGVDDRTGRKKLYKLQDLQDFLYVAWDGKCVSVLFFSWPWFDSMP